MECRFMRRPGMVAVGAVLWGILTSAGAAASTMFEITFSGTFETCDEACMTLGLGALSGTGFSGSITFPANEQEAVFAQHRTVTIPDLSNRSLYRFAEDAAVFRLRTAVAGFDPILASPPRFIINQCIHWTCPINANYFWIAAGEGGFGPILYIQTGTIADTTFPTFEELITMLPYMNFEITAFEGRARIGVEAFEVALAEITIVTPVPLPPAAWLLVGVGWPLVRVRARDNPTIR